MQTVKIRTEFITLGQFLKFTGFVFSGGDIKYVLETEKVWVNNEIENRRGKKIYPGMKITFRDQQFLIEKEC